MLQNRLFSATLVALVSIPGFLIGQKLRAGESNAALLMIPIALAIVFLAGALMRQSERP